MKSGCYASPETLIAYGLVKPTDSVRAIKKYVSFFNKYTDKHSNYPKETLQEWLVIESERQAELESSEQLTLGELVEEVEEQDETPGEIFRTSELQDVAEEESGIEEQEDRPGEDFRMFDGQVLPERDITPLVVIKERNETENVSRETEIETQRYSFANRDKIREFYGDYTNWSISGILALWLKYYRHDFRNGMYVFAVESTSCKDIENMTPHEKKVRYFWSDRKCTYEVSVLDMERYIATIKDEL